MLENEHVSRRFIQRLAEGVKRDRLVEPILAARPPLVLVSAPAGYGKTVLAAQIVSSDLFSRAIWIGRAGEGACIHDALRRLLECLGADSPETSAGDVYDLCHACGEELAGLPDGSTLAVVFDDAAWAADAQSLEMLEGVMAEAPLGSTAIVTTRADGAHEPSLPSMWGVTASQLMLSDEEIGLVWCRHGQCALDDRLVARVASKTGRHAALVSLMARQTSLLGTDIGRAEPSASAASLIDSLVDSQLDSRECELLDYAAVMGEGSIESLSRCSGHSEVARTLNRIATVLPLVSVSKSVSHRRFSVHSLVRDVRDSVRTLAKEQPKGMRRVFEALLDEGATAQVISLAVASADSEAIANYLRLFGSRLLKGESWEVVRSALDVLPAAVVASEPGLLLLKAELTWILGERNAAIRQALLAVRLVELSCGGGPSLSARSMLAGMRMASADFEGAISALEPFLENGPEDPDDLADLLYAAVPAYAFSAQKVGMARCQELAAGVIERSQVGSARLARLEMVLALGIDITEGDTAGSYVLLSRAAARSDVPRHWKAVTLSNLASTALEMGDLEGAQRFNGEAARISGEYTTPLDRSLQGLIAASTVALADGVSIRPAVDAVMAACDGASDNFTLTTTCTMGAPIALATREQGFACQLAERCLQTSVQTGSPILIWLAQLVHAQASLAIGDVERGRLVAERILPQAESLGAMNHVLHARMILAQAALHDGDLATAVQHLSSVADHIVDKSPALTVASYLRAFPGMLGPLALAMGVDRIPVRVLNLVTGDYATAALEQAAAVLTPAEVLRLSHRMAKEAARAAASEESSEPEKLTCSVRLFGGLEVVTPRGVVGDRDWGKRKARLLFAMLVSRFGTDIPRGEIVEYLWPDMDEERALNNFYVVWSAMKRAISPESVRESGSPFVEHARGVCRIVPGRVVSDLDLFTEEIAHARRAREAGDAAGELAALRTVAELYRGEVLPGDVYDDWFAPLRERFRHEFEDAMLRAAQILENRGEPREGLSLLRRATAHDPWREDLYQATLRLQLVSGQRSAAIETYMTCRARLVDDLGIDPSRETTALYEQVLGMEERSEY